MRNMLHLNEGVDGAGHLRFSEIGQLAGVSNTDWSWAGLFADFDNDGWKDLFISNGYLRDFTNLDFLKYTVPDAKVQAAKEGHQHFQTYELVKQMPSNKLTNYMFRNNSDLGFTNVSAAWGLTQPGVSNSAAYADLDNDGDLDLVVNNINGEAAVMRNDLTPGTHYLTLVLKGDTLNRDGIGATVYAYCRTYTQELEQYPVRGYLSSMDRRLHFGFGARPVDSLKIVWPDGRTQVIISPPLDTILLIDHTGATTPASRLADHPPTHFFQNITAQANIDFTHKERFFYDYGIQPLIQQKFSQEGPFISTGDVNGDGLQDFFIGGAFQQSGKLFLQQPGGSFKSKDLVTGVKNEEDMQSALFDADGDGDPDLLIAGGSSEFEINSSFYRPRLYLNDGKGNFQQDNTAFSPLIRTPAKCIATADMDGDGDLDIFLGGRILLGSYPTPPRSYILRNDHGRFTDVTSAVCPALETPGLINAAVWTDIDHDNHPDLVIAGDWMPIRVFINNGHTLTELTTPGLPTGFWRSLAVTDIDQDGDMDLLAGNLGLNNPFHISTERPAQLMAKDFDGNGIVEPIFCYYIKDDDGSYRLSTGISRDQWARQMPSIKKTFDRNELYATASMDMIFTKEMMTGATTLDCKETRSGYFENNGRGQFSFHPFPIPAQMAPVNAIIADDVDKDGALDILLAGNEYQAAVPVGRYDASYGLLLTGNGKGHFDPVPPVASGLILDGDVRDLKVIHAAGQRILLVAVNDQPMNAFRY